MTLNLKAMIWDLDGTLAETERDGHRVALADHLHQLKNRHHAELMAAGAVARICRRFSRPTFAASCPAGAT
jgi:phosphoglycolate phosphatase-like HAD superfamily hydrolase